jgi:hypothetical protein
MAQVQWEICYISKVQKRVVGLKGNLHRDVQDMLACFVLKEKCPGGKVRDMVGDIENLTELWLTLDMATTDQRSVLQRPCNK